MEIQLKSKLLKIVLILLIFIPYKLSSSDVDFTIFIKNQDGSLRYLTDKEVIPLNNEIQIKIYSKSRGELDILYESATTKKSSILNEPLSINPGQLLTLPGDDSFLPMELSEGNVKFEFAFVSESEKIIKGYNFYAIQPNPKRIDSDGVSSDELIKNNLLNVKYINTFESISNISNLSKSISSSVKNNTSNLKINKLRGFEDLYDKTAKGTVLVESYDENENPIGFGSGAIISKNQIVTNVHVINNATYILVVPYGGLEDINKPVYYLATIEKIIPDKDLALLKINEVLQNPLEIDKTCNIKIASDAHAVGHPEGNFWSYTKGYISQVRDNYVWNYSDNQEFQAQVIQTQTPINPGNSGGPLVNSESKLIGINSFGFPEAPGINFAVSCNEIINLIESGYSFNGWEDISKNEKRNNDDLSSKCIDEDKNGYEEACYVDRDNNGKFDLMLYDENQDNEIDAIYYDEDENEIAETILILANSTSDLDYDVYYHDSDQDGNYDDIMYDYDLDGEIDKVSPIS